MLRPLNLLKNFADALLKPAAPESEDAPAIDIWVYAEPAGEEPDPLKRNVLQWRRVISSVRAPLDEFPGQPVDVVGFVHCTPNDDRNQFTVARHIIRCCLADTVPLGLAVQWEGSFVPESWVRVRGKFARVAGSAGEKLVIVPTSVKVIPQPQKLYINGVF
ncbi:TIGR03943 family putative permease subunit [Leptolyngbya ohadii]|uniref:TIGR03943 family putative permease subunit n=1 Tax=Leptolyngbya ohadii TaxID=1962290 RepID=UPI00117B0BDA|nr:TIGR03943 family protein [Leptolyngbya ohadii]